jgi:hypothetical protein
MRRVLPLVAVAAALAACDTGGGGADDPPGGRTRASADVGALVRAVEEHHPDPYHVVARDDFRRAADELRRRIDGLGRDAALVELMRLAALLGERDGHTGLFPLDPAHRRPLHLYPIRIYELADGPVVVDAFDRPDLVGARVESIAGVALDRVREAVAPLVPRDNAHSLAARVTQYMTVAEVLHGLGITSAAGPARFGLRLPDGSERELTLAPVPAEAYARRARDLFHPMVPPGLPRRPAPAALARRLEPRWLAMLDGGRAAYVAYNVTLGDTAGVARRLLRMAGRPRVRRVILDVRHNPGGDNFTYAPLLEALQRIGRRPGRLHVLIGRTTFSAAANLVSELERTAHVTFVGEPTGGSPNLYGDPVAVELPVTGWTANVAAVYWQKGRAGDARTAIEPDVAIALTADDLARGRDPALAAALAP